MKPVPVQIRGASDEPAVFRCQVAIVRESDGTFSAIVLNLSGVGSCGDTEDEAIAHVREAVAAAVDSFREDGAEIPWLDSSAYTIPDGTKALWISVNA